MLVLSMQAGLGPGLAGAAGGMPGMSQMQQQRMRGINSGLPGLGQ